MADKKKFVRNLKKCDENDDIVSWAATKMLFDKTNLEFAKINVFMEGEFIRSKYNFIFIISHKTSFAPYKSSLDKDSAPKDERLALLEKFKVNFQFI